MRKTLLIATAVGVTAALSACGGDAADTAAPTVTEVVTETVPAPAPEAEVVTETVTVTQEAAPEAAEPADTESTESADTKDAEPEDTESEQDQSNVERFGEPVYSDREGLVKEVGQLAAVVNPETEETIVQFTVTDIETDFQCTNDYAEESANGQFVALTFEVETFEADHDSFFGYFDVNPFYLTAFAQDGTLQNDILGNSWTCLDDADMLPSSIGTSQRASGKVVIDTSLESGWINFNPVPHDGSGFAGWEWEF